MPVVPYVPGKLHHRTRQWAEGNSAQLCELSSDNDAYWKQLVEWWSQPGDLTVVEQDNLPADGVMESFRECQHDWCTSPYEIRWCPRSGIHLWVTHDGVNSASTEESDTTDDCYLWIAGGLGCTKFSDELKQKFPRAITDQGDERQLDGYPPAIWWLIDLRLSRTLRAAGLTPHMHERSTHLNPYLDQRISKSRVVTAS